MSKQSTYGHLRFPMMHIIQPSLRLWCIWFFLSTLAACAPSTSSPTTVPVDQPAPESTIRALYEALNLSNLQMLQAVLAPNDKWNEAAVRGFKYAWENGSSFEITDLTIDIVEIDDRRARARTRYHETMRSNGLVALDRESGSILTLDRIGDRWYFVGLGQQPSPPGWVQPNELPTPMLP